MNISLLLHIMIYALIPLIIGVAYTIMMIKKAHKLIGLAKEKKITVHFPRSYIAIGLIVMLFFLTCLALMEAFPNGTGSAWVAILFMFFIVLGIIIVIVGIVWKIYIFKDEDYLVYVTALGRSYKIYYNQISGYIFTRNRIKIKTQKKAFYVESEAVNIKILFEMFRKNKIPQNLSRKDKGKH